MSPPKLTVGDVMLIINYLDRAKTTADEAEKAKIDELIDKLKGMKV